MERNFSWPVLVTPANPLDDVDARSRRVEVIDETAARNRGEARGQEDLLRARADPPNDALQASIDEEDGKASAAKTAQGGTAIFKEPTARLTANP